MIGSTCMRRYSALIKYLLSALWLGMCAAFGGSAAFAQTNTPVTGVNVGGGLFDIIASHQGDPTQALNNYMASLAAINARWVRVGINWDTTQHTRTSTDPNDPNPVNGLDWGTADTVIRAARNHGLRMLGLITMTPQWAIDPACPEGTSGSF